MIDDMKYHVNAWYRILNELGANVSYERAKEECYGKNHELLERIFPGRFTDEEKDKISLEKEREYQLEFKPHLRLLNGLDDFLEQAQAGGIKMAIGSAAIQQNIDFVIDGLHIRHYFKAVISADQVSKSKPEPETFLQCAEGLGIAAADCLVFEDAPKGVESAQNAGMDCLVLTTLHDSADFMHYKNIIAFAPDYEGLAI